MANTTILNVLRSIDLLRYILSYLPQEDSKFLLNTTRLLIPEKKLSVYWHLNKRTSTLYVKNIAFRHHLSTLVAHPVKQIALTLDNCPDIEDLGCLQHIKSVSLRNCPNIRDATPLKYSQELNLSRCHKITDISVLSNVRALNLSNCHSVTSVSSLADVHTLNLSHCRGIMDVSALGSVHTLKLHNTGVFDVSSLGSVYCLELDDCQRLQTVSHLGAVHTLSLKRCNHISSVEALCTVYTLSPYSGLSVLPGCIFTVGRKHTRPTVCAQRWGV